MFNCKHCKWDFLKGYSKCSSCGNSLSLFGKKEVDKINTDLEINISADKELEYIKTIDSLNEKINLLQKQVEYYKNKFGIYDVFSIEYVDTLDGIEFEEYTKILLEKLGYENVYTTPASGDFGIDVIAEKEGIKYGIQCKNYKEQLSNKCVQEAYSGKEYYKCHIGAVLTNSYFSPHAIEQAKSSGILLWDRNTLIKMIEKAK